MEIKWNGLQKFYDPNHTSATVSRFELYSLTKYTGEFTVTWSDVTAEKTLSTLILKFPIPT